MDARGMGTNLWIGGDMAAGLQNFGVLAPRPQHGTVFNVLSGDGHVSAVPLSILFNPTNSARNWNVDHLPHPECWQRGVYY